MEVDSLVGYNVRLPLGQAFHRGESHSKRQTSLLHGEARIDPRGAAAAGYNRIAMSLRFEWDPRKEMANKRKHGVTFGEATTVFADPLGRTMPDPDHSLDECRLATMGMSSRRTIFVVTHTDRGGRVRIISPRSATAAEVRDYEEIP